MVSGAGRRLTVRSAAARLARPATDRGSRRYAAAFAAATIALIALPLKRPGISSQLLIHRSSVLNRETAVSFTNNVARHSFKSPDCNAAKVCGISTTRAFAKPSNLDPRFGDSRLANAT